MHSLCPSLCTHYSDFLREAHVLSKLRHPNLLVLYGVCLEAGHEMIVTELVGGGSLFDAIHPVAAGRKGSGKAAALERVKGGGRTKSWRWRLQVMLRCARGMAHLHKCGIMHRDLKSLNGECECA
jgi:serine/threonine protein kinase